MKDLLERLATKIYVGLLRRRQIDSRRLRVHFSRRHAIEVGLYSYGCFDQWRMPGPMKVGRYCSIATSARSALVNHPMGALTTHPLLYETRFGLADHDMRSDRPLVIEDDVWIAHNVMILPGCKFIGRGAIVGAGSIVTSDVDRYSVVVGNPARKIRDRFPPEVIAEIEATRWWELSLDELRGVVGEHRAMAFSPTVEALRRWRHAAPPAASQAETAA